MKRPTLFDNRPRTESAGPWQIIRTGGHGLWRHVESGWSVHRAGGELWPYYATAPDCPRRLVGRSGRGFRTLEEAKRAVEGMWMMPAKRIEFLNEPDAGPYRF